MAQRIVLSHKSSCSFQSRVFLAPDFSPREARETMNFVALERHSAGTSHREFDRLGWHKGIGSVEAGRTGPRRFLSPYAFHAGRSNSRCWMTSFRWPPSVG